MKISISTMIVAILVLSSLAQGSTVVDLIGDKDGFGLGVLDGQGFDWTTVGLGDGDGTDVWRHGDFSWNHTYDLLSLGGPVASASLAIFHGGDGFGSLSEVFVNGTSVGFLTDLDDVGPAYNYAALDVLDLTPYVGLLAGADTINVQVASSDDGWVLDYSELTVSSIPEPATMALLGLGGLLLRRRK